MSIRTRCATYLSIACMLAAQGCGGPTQAVLDRAERETNGLAESPQLEAIDMPTSEVASAGDSYQVTLASAGSSRPQMPSGVPESATIETPTIRAFSETVRLNIGDPAPALAIEHWSKGTPIDQIQQGQVYVVEFWATWCGPCKMNMPHLSKLQQQYGEQVHFIGVTDEKASVIERFLTLNAFDGKSWNDVLQYRLAIDQQKTTKTSYMQASGERGIPCAYIVGRDGRIHWIGHPAKMDQPLAAIVAGKWDLAHAKIQRDVVKTIGSLRKQVSNLLRQNKHEQALAVVDAAIAKFPDTSAPLLLKLDVLRSIGRFADSYAVIQRIVDLNWTDPNLLSQLAWVIAAETKGADRDLDLALRSAHRSVELTQEQAPIALDTLARVYFEKGNYDQAVTWQTKAVNQNPGKYAVPMNKALESYKAAAAQ